LKPIAFIIITYNRPEDMLALLQNISMLKDADSLLEEVIVVNNASAEDYSPVKSFIARTELPYKYFEAPENLGVTKGRNYAIAKSKAPILVLLDDDAELQTPDTLQSLVTLFENNMSPKPTGIVSFKVLYYDTGQMQVNAFPHKQFKRLKDQSFFETYYYAGGAHAVKREVLEKTGPYPEEFFYGMEEYDMSYRILEAGYSIVYSDKIVMLHKESPLGRRPQNEKLLMMWVNKCKVAFRYLPKRYFYSTALMWSLQYLKKTGFHLSGFFKGWKHVFAIPNNEKRMPLNEKTIQYLKKVKARLLY
jgi:GT2 family glycosyltransferase